MQRPLNIGTEAAWKKITSYCAYQERCHAEVKDKLYSFDLYPHEVDELIAKLIEENFLNESRFAIAFAGGKFRMNQWGRVKIKYALQQKKVSVYCIKEAINAIDDAAYLRTLTKLANTKFASLKKAGAVAVRLMKVRAYLVQKGFEHGMVGEVLDGIKKKL